MNPFLKAAEKARQHVTDCPAAITEYVTETVETKIQQNALTSRP